MYGSQEKKLGKKVNVKLFTVDPYWLGTPIPPGFEIFTKSHKIIFLKLKNVWKKKFLKVSKSQFFF